VRGDSALAPRVEVLASDLLDVQSREAVRRRLTTWLAGHLRSRLGPLFQLREAPNLGGTARGLAFTLGESLGSVPRRAVADLVTGLAPAERRALAELGVRLGRWVVFLPALLDASRLRLRALLFSVANAADALPLPTGHTTGPWDGRVPARYYAACGYHPVGPAIWRVDRLERALQALHEQQRAGQAATAAEQALAWGVREDEARALLLASGFTEGQDGRFARRSKGRPPGVAPSPRSRSRAGRHV
jgi:ATP-dependent RNA helicase SUPV3L1/SUV3